MEQQVTQFDNMTPQQAAHQIYISTAGPALKSEITAACQHFYERGGLGAVLASQMEWSKLTFGSGYRTVGITKHIEKELAEIRDKPEDLSEWIDVIILALDGYWRHGGTPNTIMRDLLAKQAKNRTRTYPVTAEDEPSEHLR